MKFEDRVCCICNEHKKFLAQINAGKKLYCMQCEAKITKEYGSNYWKPCSFREFFENWSKEIRDKRKRNMFNNLRTDYL
ncbi:MAG: hypothetical protein DSN69_07060 [Nitrosopumilus sp. YT1]|nr:MAG: hypothetical protein DSN69_07060 [Nitrosopumilus sp. YT1]